MSANGSVFRAAVDVQRAIADRGIVNAIGISHQRKGADGGVVIASGVILESTVTNRHVEAAARVIDKRTITQKGVELGRVAALLASGLGYRRKRQTCRGQPERDEKITAPPRRAVMRV